MDTTTIIAAVIALVVGFGVGGAIFFFAGINHRKKQAEAEIGSAEKEAERLVEAAKTEAENQKKLALLDAKEEIQKSRAELEKE
ncbi:MAG: Rnase Y domain-containing protein, partial [Oscillospiraceae bacterium]